MLTGMRLITGLELLFWFLAMITRIYFKFENNETSRKKIDPNLKETAALSLQRKLRRYRERKGRIAYKTTTKVSSTSENVIKKRLDAMKGSKD